MVEIVQREKLIRAVDMLKAIAHPVRLSIIELLAENGEMCVSQIQKGLQIEQAVISQQLKILKNKELVSAYKNGKYCYYELTTPEIEKLLNCVENCQSC